MYFAQRPIFEHSVSGVGNLPLHVIYRININLSTVLKLADTTIKITKSTLIQAVLT